MFSRKRPTTVFAAVAPLLHVIADLERVVDLRNEALARNGEEIGRLETQMQTDQTELSSAEEVSKRIQAITSPALLSAKDAPPEA